jgi:hypothetical protein
MTTEIHKRQAISRQRAGNWQAVTELQTGVSKQPILQVGGRQMISAVKQVDRKLATRYIGAGLCTIQRHEALGRQTIRRKQACGKSIADKRVTVKAGLRKTV